MVPLLVSVPARNSSVPLVTVMVPLLTKSTATTLVPMPAVFSNVPLLVKTDASDVPWLRPVSVTRL